MAQAKQDQSPQDKPALVPVVFNRPWGRYVKGDKAHFEPDVAERLVKTLKVAEA